MADESRTEQASPRRRQRAQHEGNVPRSRELPAALALMTLVLYIGWCPQTWKNDWRELIERTFTSAAHSDMAGGTPILNWVAWRVCLWAAPCLALAWLAALAGSFALGGFVVAPAALAPRPARLNPASNLQKLYSLAGLQGLLKSLIPSAFVLYIVLAIMVRDWSQILQMCRMALRPSLGWMLSRIFEICWKSGLVFTLWAGFDVLISRMNYERQIRMTRQEAREDFKETEGHPAVRGRIRRLQREMRRRRMLRDVARATVVVTNPSEYAVALEYKPETMAAPVVVAKGRNLLAQRIKREATWHGIPVVENPPLAQALYRAARVGQAIPAKLYTAVAEILAFIYRTQRLARS
ncbi:MAG TPA: EscU/YscU/HrcU family type III secretion system export apparatus switch protein [Terriglobia bacterium]|nr:EscU/YscU/HrcU family type III secretion system export apparatus switch protein [Terriglobia bacterium]